MVDPHGLNCLLVFTCLVACADAANTKRVSEAQKPTSEWHSARPWQLVTDLTIGSIEGNGPNVFAAVGGIEVDSTGRIFVLERESKELRVFDSSGKHVRTTGRSGLGPGEFDAPNGLEWLPGMDSLLIIDGSGNRYSIMNDEGHFVRSLVRPLTSHSYTFEGGFANGLFYEQDFVRVNNVSEPVLIGMRLGAQVSVIDTFALPPPSGPAVPPFEVRNSRGGGMYLSVPYVPRAAWHLSQDGTLWWGFGREYRILKLDLGGDTLASLVGNDQHSTPVSSDDLMEWEQNRSVTSFKERGGVLDIDRIPKTKPFFTHVFVDDERFLWVDISTADRRTAFDIFDERGAFLGRLSTGIRRSPYVKPRFRNGRVYLVGVDELDVPFLHVYRIDRSGT